MIKKYISKLFSSGSSSKSVAYTDHEIYQQIELVIKKYHDGDTKSARDLIRKLARVQSGDIELLTELGKISAQNNDVEYAIDCLNKAVQLADSDSRPYIYLANVYRMIGKPDQAISLYKSVLDNDESNLDALINLGMLSEQENDLEKALTYYRKASDIYPDSVTPLLLAGKACLSNAASEDARKYLEKALAIDTGNPDVHYNLALTFYNSGNYDESIKHFTDYLESKPDNIEATYNLALAFIKAGKNEDALIKLETVIKYEPTHARALYHAGNINRELGKNEDAEDLLRLSAHYMPERADVHFALASVLRQEDETKEEAISEFERAIELKPDFAECYFQLGTLQIGLTQFDKALQNLNKAIELDPDYIDAINNKGMVYRYLGKYDDAYAQFNSILEREPENYNALINIATVLCDKKEYAETLRIFDDLLEKYPDNDELIWNLSHAFLLLNRYEKGWEGYDKRWTVKNAIKSRPFKFRVWSGDTEPDSTLLIYGEQGLGDEIMFASCFADIMGRVKKTIIECDPRLAAIFSRSFPSASVVGRTSFSDDAWLSDYPEIDCQIAMGSIPRLVRRSISDFSHVHQYLVPDPGKLNKWQQRLSELGDGLKIGISWRGGTVKSRTNIRSVTLDMWHPILALPDSHFISLQYTDCKEELDSLHASTPYTIHHWQEAIDDYDETAALVSSLDMVVSVATSVVSLAGALGKTAWVMVPFSPGWMYGTEGDTTPWFESVRVFRQTEANRWDDVIQVMADELAGYSIQ
jgi:tetratricopeptide (TPR) repeat protein